MYFWHFDSDKKYHKIITSQTVFISHLPFESRVGLQLKLKMFRKEITVIKKSLPPYSVRFYKAEVQQLTLQLAHPYPAHQ